MSSGSASTVDRLLLGRHVRLKTGSRPEIDRVHPSALRGVNRKPFGGEVEQTSRRK
jgi:hypothetical protein